VTANKRKGDFFWKYLCKSFLEELMLCTRTSHLFSVHYSCPCIFYTSNRRCIMCGLDTKLFFST
jgi:hypothetical protein